MDMLPAAQSSMAIHILLRDGRKTLFGVNPEWYKTHVTDAGIQSISIKIPASTETIRKSV